MANNSLSELSQIHDFSACGLEKLRLQTSDAAERIDALDRIVVEH